ncbi:hypothetical protein KFU94_17680 [Chloroflexi bacterium TSY]|nr:hypothetical protein [Chloroflexi bacterium TSY]
MAVETNLVLAEMHEMGSQVASRQVNHRRNYQWALLTVDALMLTLAFTIAYWLRFTVGVEIFRDGDSNALRYLQLVVLLVPGWLSICAALRLYDFRFLLGGTQEYARTVNACTSGMMLVIILSFLFDKTHFIARGWLILSWGLSCFLLCSGRFLLRRIAYSLREKGYFVSPALIVGANEEALALAQQLSNGRESGVALFGFVDDNVTDSIRNAVTQGKTDYVLGKLSNLTELIRHHGITEVIVATTALSREQLLEVHRSLAEFPEINLRLSSGLYEVLTTNVQVSMLGGVPLMDLCRVRLDPIEMFIKRILDCTLVLWGSIVLIPLFAIISLSRSKFGVFGYFQSRLQGFWSHLFRFRLQKTGWFRIRFTLLIHR